MNRKSTTILLAAFLSIVLCLAYIGFLESRLNKLLLEKRKASFELLDEQVKKEIAAFADEASIVIEDLDKGWEIALNEDELFPAASLVKVPIMAACFYAANNRKIDLGEKICLKPHYKVGGSGSLKNEPAGKEFTVLELIELMITESDNTATNILIDYLGFAYLNDTFKKLGLENTNIDRKMMDFKKRKRGIENFTTAKDCKFLLNEIYNKNLINERVSAECLNFLKRQKSRDRIAAKLPPDILVAHKTGLERTVCHDIGIVFTRKGDFLICVLTKHRNRNSKKSKDFIAEAAFLTYNYYRKF